MALARRKTIVVHSRLRRRELRLTAARNKEHGLQILSFEQLATRLAGGLLRPVDNDSLRDAIKAVLPNMELGELDRIKLLPGMVNAAADTLRKAWRAGIDLGIRASLHTRIESVARLEEAVLTTLPAAQLRPSDLVAEGLKRLGHAPVLFGSIDIDGITELSPVWRPLLHALATVVPVRWLAGPRPVPDWLQELRIEPVSAKPCAPSITSVSAATPFHEAVESLRWARHLVVSGVAKPADIAIASATPAEYDEHFFALREDANLDLHFVHGIPVTSCREGQAAGALTDVLISGLSQRRLRRLNALLRAYPGPFRELPEGWTRILPANAPLATPEAWSRVIDGCTPADWPNGTDGASALRDIIALLSRGIKAAEEAGEHLLHGRTLRIWRSALRAGAITALDRSLEELKQDDGLEPSVSACWMSASELAASPRRFVRLLGLNSSRWPRGIVEDRLLSDHVIPNSELDPLPIAEADRRDFRTILATTANEITLSFARRDATGRRLGRSTLLVQASDRTIELRRNAVPEYAFSETDRLTARPQDFRTTSQASASAQCWNNWASKEITAHDGLIRSGHPGVRAVLGRVQSASSLAQLLSNPLGFVWKYGLGLRSPEIIEDPLMLDPRALGELVHQSLHLALQKLETNGGLSRADESEIAGAVRAGTAEVARMWEREETVPPPVIWRQTLEEVVALGCKAFALSDGEVSDGRAFGEVPFGGAVPKSDAQWPWDTNAPIEIPHAGFRISGYIDRLDISADGGRAVLCDYKSGKLPKSSVILNGGQELQRCLYAYAARTLLGDSVEIDAALLYPRGDRVLRLENPEATLEELADYLAAAHVNLAAGKAVIGKETAGRYDDLAFALPANAQASYCARKMPAAIRLLGNAVHVWEAD